MTRNANAPHWKRYLSLHFLASKVREKGIVWCTRTFCLNVRSYLDLPTRPIRANLWSVYDNIRYREAKQPDVLYAFYDLTVSPATFDFVGFLVLAELERKQASCDSLHIVFVPGPNEGFRANDLEKYRRLGGVDCDIDSMRWRLRNILLPCCWLVPSCQQVTVCTSPEEAQAFRASLVKHIFPKGYTVRFPKESHSLGRLVATTSQGIVLPTIQATPQARRFVTDWIQSRSDGRKVITITLRECSYEPYRNSNFKAWGAFARSLNSSIYCPAVIRDTETAFKPLPSELYGLTVFPEASWNIELRAALYELSYLNMSVSNGPAVLCIYNRQTRYLIFKMLTPTVRADSARYFRREGLEPGSQLKLATPLQRWVWEDDGLEVIQKEFREMCDRIEREEHKN